MSGSDRYPRVVLASGFVTPVGIDHSSPSLLPNNEGFSNRVALPGYGVIAFQKRWPCQPSGNVTTSGCTTSPEPSYVLNATMLGPTASAPVEAPVDTLLATGRANAADAVSATTAAGATTRSALQAIAVHASIAGNT